MFNFCNNYGLLDFKWLIGWLNQWLIVVFSALSLLNGRDSMNLMNTELPLNTHRICLQLPGEPSFPQKIWVGSEALSRRFGTYRLYIVNYFQAKAICTHCRLHNVDNNFQIFLGFFHLLFFFSYTTHEPIWTSNPDEWISISNIYYYYIK